MFCVSEALAPVECMSCEHNSTAAGGFAPRIRTSQGVIRNSATKQHGYGEEMEY